MRNCPARISLAIVWCLLLAPLARGQGRVELELTTEEGAPVAARQQWYQALSEMKVGGLRIAGQGKGAVTVESVGTKEAPVYRVHGVVTNRGELVLPGGRFTTADRGRVAGWLAKLAAEGPPKEGAAPRRFGLSDEELKTLKAKLAAPVDFATKGQRPADVLAQLVKTIKVGGAPAAAEALADVEPLPDEWRGLSSGTALAAVVRLAGMVIVPRKDGAGEVNCAIVKGEKELDIWPIGWPLTETKAKMLPALVEVNEVEINEIPVLEVAQAIADKLKVPLVLDQNGVARHNVDLQAKVAIPRRKTNYSSVLMRALFKPGLKDELRLDDAGKPFLWITTQKPA